jgi:hypothetical protein
MMNGNNRGVVTSDDPRFTAFKVTKSNAGSEMKGNGLKVNFCGFADTQLLKDSLRRCEAYHDRLPELSSGATIPSSSRSSNIPSTSASDSSSSLRAAIVSLT